MRLLCVGECERLKAGVHGTIEALAIVCGAYNVAAMIARKKVHPHLLRNALMYTALALIEHRHVHHHWEARRSVAADLLPPR